MFPASGIIRPAVADIQAVIDVMPVGLPRAIAWIVMILKLHPFAEGNGRVARGTFNLLIAGMGYYRYFPLSSKIAHSRRGFELAVRSVELQQDRNPIVRYMLAALALVSSQPIRLPVASSANSTWLSK